MVSIVVGKRGDMLFSGAEKQRIESSRKLLQHEWVYRLRSGVDNERWGTDDDRFSFQLTMAMQGIAVFVEMVSFFALCVHDDLI